MGGGCRRRMPGSRRHGKRKGFSIGGEGNSIQWGGDPVAREKEAVKTHEGGGSLGLTCFHVWGGKRKKKESATSRKKKTVVEKEEKLTNDKRRWPWGILNGEKIGRGGTPPGSFGGRRSKGGGFSGSTKGKNHAPKPHTEGGSGDLLKDQGRRKKVGLDPSLSTRKKEPEIS